MSRKLSWSLATLAYLGPPLWAYFSMAADRVAQTAAYGFIKCGTPQGMITILACAFSASLSLLALAFAVASFRLVPSPRPKTRVLEIGVVSLPLFVAVLVFTSLF